MKVYGEVTLSEGSDIKNLTIAHGAEYPAAANKGEFFYHDALGLSIHDGNEWLVIINNSGTPPVNAEDVMFDKTGTPFVSDQIQGAVEEISSSLGTANDAITELNTSVTKINDIYQSTNEPTGFANRSASVISFDKTTRTFTIAPTDGSYTIFVRGQKFTISDSISVTVPDVHGPSWIYFDETATLLVSNTFPSNLITHLVFVCEVYWDSSIQDALFCGDERHGIVMDGATHSYLHSTEGTKYVRGLKLTLNQVNGDGSSDNDIKIALTDGAISDEDISFSITNGVNQQLSVIAQLPVWYREGAGAGIWHRLSTVNDFPFINHLSGLNYNGINNLPPINNFNSGTGVWELTEVSNPNNFICIHIVATTAFYPGPVFAIQGSAAYSSASLAAQGASEELEVILGSSSGLPTPEFVPLHTIILECNATFTNSALSRIVSANPTIDAITYIGAKYSKNVVRNVHSTQRGLANDDHLQYAKTTGGSRASFNINAPSNGQILTYTGNEWINTSVAEQAAPVIKNMVVGDIVYATGTNQIPYDNTPPLITEGAQFWSQSFTPSADTSKILIQMSPLIESSVKDKVCIVSIFRGTTLIGVITKATSTNNVSEQMPIQLVDAPNTTQTTTYTARIGLSAAGTWKINKNDGSNGSFGSDILKHNGFSIIEF